MKYWFTQPVERVGYEAKNFASFYAFDETNGNFVRIRLELDRTPINGDNGRPVICVRKRRCVGFDGCDNLVISNQSKWKKNEENFQIKYETNLMSVEPTDGFCTYDFSAKTDGTPKNNPHKGNKVKNTGMILPADITRTDLDEIAQHFMEKSSGNYEIINSTNPPIDNYVKAIKEKKVKIS